MQFAVKSSSLARTREGHPCTECMLSSLRLKDRMLEVKVLLPSQQPIMLIKSKVIDVAASKTPKMTSISQRKVPRSSFTSAVT